MNKNLTFAFLAMPQSGQHFRTYLEEINDKNEACRSMWNWPMVITMARYDSHSVLSPLPQYSISFLLENPGSICGSAFLVSDLTTLRCRNKDQTFQDEAFSELCEETNIRTDDVREAAAASAEPVAA